MKKIAFVVSSPMTINTFMVNHIKLLSNNYDVTIIANNKLGEIKGDLPVSFINLPITRDISLLNDLICIVRLVIILKLGKFDFVHTITPKAGLVGMISAFICQVRCRFHTFTGQVWVTKTGLLKWLLKNIDRLIFSLSTFSLVDSFSQKEFLLNENVIREGKSLVLGSGSISGVDLNKFKYSHHKRIEIREQLKIPENAYVFTFLGRLCKDKGIDELIEAFQEVSKYHPSAYLILVGPNEGIYDKTYISRFFNNNIITVGHTDNPEYYFSASDSLVLPSYREGFGTTVLEAASCGIPTIASNIYGLSDAVVNEKTGLLHEVKDVESLTSSMLKLVCNPELSSTLGCNAKDRVTNHFSSQYLSEELVKFYEVYDYD